MSFCLRRAEAADADAIGTVHVQAWREAYPGLIPEEILAGLDPRQRAAMWRDGLAHGTAAVWLAERDGTLVGFGASGGQRDPSLPYSGEISAVYVLRDGQRLGIGSALMAAMAKDLLAAGHAGVTLWVLEGNHPARRFYEALGGSEVARREQCRAGHTAVGVAYGWADLHILARNAR
jgi:ribosomal protein S18 acetylase RimI-like enzyme